MEEFLVFIQKYAVFPIALICYVIGYVIKHFIPKLPNRFIPLILAVVGFLLNIAFNHFTFTVEIAITGIASGLVATGSFEMVRNLINKSNTTEKKEENKNENEENK